MYSSTDKLIDVVKSRLSSKKKNRPINNHLDGQVRYIEVRRLSTLIPRRGTVRRQTNANHLTEDKINLRLVPVMKSEKAIMILKKDNNDNNKIAKTQTYNSNDSRNKFFLKKTNETKNFCSNIYMKTLSNILSTSHSLGKTRTISKKNIFLSPFEEGKKKSKIFKILVDFSREIHSPKHKETNLINKSINIRSLKNIKMNKNQRKKNDIFLSEQFLSKKFKIKNNIFHENQKEQKVSNSNNKASKEEKNKIKYLIKRLDDSSEIIRNTLLLKNKKRKIKPNCYYNKLHLNKLNDIIEKYSYNNMD
jgi:hypothetical protein